MCALLRRAASGSARGGRSAGGRLPGRRGRSRRGCCGSTQVPGQQPEAAARLGRVAVVEAVGGSRQGVDLHTQDAADTPPLHHACINHLKNLGVPSVISTESQTPQGAHMSMHSRKWQICRSTELLSSSRGIPPSSPTLFQSIVELSVFMSVCQGALWSPIQSYLHAWQQSCSAHAHELAERVLPAALLTPSMQQMDQGSWCRGMLTQLFRQVHCAATIANDAQSRNK